MKLQSVTIEREIKSGTLITWGNNWSARVNEIEQTPFGIVLHCSGELHGIFSDALEIGLSEIL